MVINQIRYLLSSIPLKKEINRLMSTMSKPKILITRPDIPESGLNILKEHCDITMWVEKSSAPREFVIKNIVGKDGLYCFLTDHIDKELLDVAGPNLKVVSTYSVGYDHIDINECKNRNIKIGYTPDVLTEATAELTVGLLLCTSRRLIEANKHTVEGLWKTWSPNYLTGPGLKNATVGVVGFGRIGQSVARKLKAFDTKQILYYNRSDRSKEALEINAKRVDLDNLLKESDFVICCNALTKETQNLFNYNTFSKMKPNSVFINTSRGGLVDQQGLIRALKEKKIWGAGLDVTTPEPLPTDNPLFKLPNCVIFPHIGSATIETRSEMAEIAANNLVLGLKGGEMPAQLK